MRFGCRVNIASILCLDEALTLKIALQVQPCDENTISTLVDQTGHIMINCWKKKCFFSVLVSEYHKLNMVIHQQGLIWYVFCVKFHFHFVCTGN